jgi:ribA/ribD-fused uncharacterized protein
MKEEKDIINFWRTNDLYGEFFNFWHSPISILGIEYKTVEHFYQSQKFLDFDTFESIIECNTPHQAAIRRRDKSLPLRKDWEEVKIKIMQIGLKAKFDQHPALKDLLISTENKILIEDSPVDYFWGIGKDKTGQNMLGKLLMELRDAYTALAAQQTY